MTPLGGTLRDERTGVRIGRLGFGCARVFGGSETRASARLIEASLASGIAHFDTAPSYSWGQSEEVLGEVAGSVPGITIATKVGLAASGGPSRSGALYRRFARPVLARVPALKGALLKVRGAPAEAALPPPRILGAVEIEASLTASLKRLRRSSVDLLLVHEPDQFVLDEALRERFEALMRGGAVRAFGLAYGRAAPPGARFGQVLQGAFDGAGEAGRRPPLPIYHGVARDRAGLSAPAAIARALRDRPGAAVIFSASAPGQIRDVAEGI